MTFILFIIFFFFCLNLLPISTKWYFPKLEKIIIPLISFICIIIFFLIVLYYNGYHLKGVYTNTSLLLVFILLSILYFSFVKNTKKKLFSFLIIIPLLSVSLFTVLFVRLNYEKIIDEKHKILVCNGGILGCGETLRFTKTKFIIFDKVIYFEEKLCIKGINNIETESLSNEQAKFLIFHDGDLDSENPFKYSIEIKNIL